MFKILIETNSGSKELVIASEEEAKRIFKFIWPVMDHNEFAASLWKQEEVYCHYCNGGFTASCEPEYDVCDVCCGDSVRYVWKEVE